MNTEYNVWRNRFFIRENPDWKKNYPVGPVHFDIKCSCGTEHINLSPLQLPMDELSFYNYFPCCCAKVI